MRRAKDEQSEETPGGDSFLDIVANIVGILVLLVVLVGIRASREILVAAEQTQAAEIEPIDEIEKRTARLVATASRDHREAIELREKIAATALETERRNEEREFATMYVTKLRDELDDAAEALTADDRRSLESHNKIAQAQLTLERLTREQIALSSVEPEPDVETVTVAPTPIVNGKVDETISFRLKSGQMIYMPIDELQSELVRNIGPPAIKDPSKAVVTSKSAGPIEGFSADAQFIWAVRARDGRMGLTGSIGRVIIRESTSVRSETIETAIAPGGYVASRLELLDPREYVVRLFVYEDSFEKLPKVQESLRKQGFRVALSLKSNGDPIAFSPNGYSAVTQ